MWQNNTSWKEGLFSEIPFKRFKAIWNKSQWDSPLALFTRLNTNDGYDLANLRLIGILLSSSPAMKPMNTLFTPDYYIVAIDTRLRTTDCSVEVKTQDGILGKARVTLEYQVSNPESLFSVDDPLFILKNRAGEAIQELISNKNYFSLDELNIENTLQVLEGKSETGISLKGFFNLQINWAESFTNRLENNVLDKLDDKTQRKLNRLKLDKLKDFGINDPILIASVLSQNDSDFEVIMNHVRSFSQAKKDEIERDINLLNWLKEKDFLTRADVQKVIDSLSAKSDDQQKTANTFNFDNNTISNSAIGDNSVVVVGKRKIDLPDESNSTNDNQVDDTNEIKLPEKETVQVTINGTNNLSSVAGGNLEYEDEKEFQFSAAYPLTLSKRFESVILCQIYLRESRPRALRNIKLEFHELPHDEKKKTSLIKLGQKITVKLDGSDFSYSEPVTKTVNDSLMKFVFIVKPNDTCEPGYHKIKASIIDTMTGEEFDYLVLNHVRVVDFAFDHISRPFLSRVSAVVLGIGSFAMFILTFLEQIDKTIGLTSGTAAGVLALGIYVSFYNLYQRVHPNTP